MSFGFFVNNANGERVIDDTSPLMHVITETTLSFTSGSSGQYLYDMSAYLDANSLVFVNVPVGAFLCVFTNTFYFPNSTMTIRKCALADTLPALTAGFGMQVFDAAGKVTFRADKSIIDISAPYLLPGATFGTGTVATASEDWFCIPNTQVYYQTSGPTNLRLAEGLLRADASTLKGQSISNATGPGITTAPLDLLVVAAK